MTDMDPKYQEALDFLYSFIDYSLKRNFRYSAEKFNLDRMRKLMELLGDPQRNFPIIHIAGTKGKGSVSAMCASVLRAQGYKTGLYTSPHMVDFTERIQVNGQYIEEAEVVEIVDTLKLITKKVPEITTFELTTAMAFVYFAKTKVDYAVIEVGLGGRLDATNVVSPMVSVITSISYDHVNILGHTLSEIAGEKGGIIKPNTPVVIAPQKTEAFLRLKEIAEKNNAPVIQIGRDYLYAADAHSLERQTFLVWTRDEQPLVDTFIESAGRDIWSPTRFRIPLLGYHQIENATTAYATLKVLEKQGVVISQKSYQTGFASVQWPGRMEIIHQHPTVLIDSAHNRYSTLVLRKAIDDYFPGLPIILVFGASEDKDIDGMFQELLPRVWKVIATRSTHPRSIDPEIIVNLAHRFGRPAQAITPIEEAMRAAVDEAGRESVVLVTGSIFTAAAARDSFASIRFPNEDHRF